MLTVQSDHEVAQAQVEGEGAEDLIDPSEKHNRPRRVWISFIEAGIDLVAKPANQNVDDVGLRVYVKVQMRR